MTVFDGIMLWVPDVRRSTAFWEEAFGVAPRWVRDEGDYAQLETGATTLQLAAESAAPTTGVEITPNRPTGAAPGFQVTLAVEDVAVAHARALSAGAREIASPVTKPWGQTVSYVQDLDGILVELSTSSD